MTNPYVNNNGQAQGHQWANNAPQGENNTNASPFNNPANNGGYNAPETNNNAPAGAPQGGNGIAGASGNAPAGNLADMFNRGTVAGGDQLTPKDGSTIGRPVLIRPTKAVDGMNTSNGLADAVEAEWVWLDEVNPGQPVNVHNGLIFGKVLNNSLRSTLASPTHAFVLGVIAKGEARNGNNAPWILDDVNDDVVPVAGQVVTTLGWV